MAFTTHFGLHSQTTRLVEHASQRPAARHTHGTLTLSGAPFQGTSCRRRPERVSVAYNSGASAPDSKLGLVPLRSPLLGESLLVSFPPLTDMLKFGGWSWLR